MEYILSHLAVLICVALNVYHSANINSIFHLINLSQGVD